MKWGSALVRSAAMGVATLLLASQAVAADVVLNIESWRNEDLLLWQNKIIPAFEAKHPGIKVKFAPTSPAAYNAALNSKLQAGSAGDLVTCRPFDASLDLYKKGYLADLTALPGMENFTPVAKAAWQTDDRKHTFCVPMASVLHGFIYNKALFAELGLTPPETVDEFFAVLDKIKKDGRYIPLVMGTNDQWEAATMGYNNIGPNYWKGEEGRLALIDGTQKLTDEGWVAPYRQLARWRPYLGSGFSVQSYADSQNIFAMRRGVIYAAGSFEISAFNGLVDFEMGAFKPPVPKKGDHCYISDHPDIGIGLNAASPHADAARAFLTWIASKEFATIYSNALPGFFSLSKADVPVKDPLAQEFVSWRKSCSSTVRYTYQVLSRGWPNLDLASWNASVQALKGEETPEHAGARLQGYLDHWYKPPKHGQKDGAAAGAQGDSHAGKSHKGAGQ